LYKLLRLTRIISKQRAVVQKFCDQASPNLGA
jgi:hypothetical protein